MKKPKIFIVAKQNEKAKNIYCCPFGSVFAVVFQSVFRVEIHQNDVFLFFKNYV